MAHEIAHIHRHHLFQQSYHLHHNLHGQNEKAKKLGEMKRSRELEFMARLIGDGSITEPESSHPGYEERLAALRAHYDAMEQQPPAAESST